MSKHFDPALFRVLQELKANNDRAWFQENRERYERDVREPLTQFVLDFGAPLRKISRHFLADPRPVGGSIFRIHRDTRFAKDKSPYKTHAAAQFRHAAGKDAHAPCFYLHLEPGNVFGGAGIWHPDGLATQRIREGIVAKSARWKRILAAEPFRRRFDLAGDSLKRPPRGFDPDHPLAHDLKRKDFIAVTRFTDKQACAAGFLERYAERCRAAAPLVRFVTEALGLDW